MTVAQVSKITCGQCHVVKLFDKLQGAQDAGWVRFEYRAVGSAPEHASAKADDLCPECFDAVKKAMQKITPHSRDK